MSQMLYYRKGQENKPFPGELLYMFRTRTTLTQAQLADRLGLKSSRMVLNWEGGYFLPPAPRLKKMIEILLNQSAFTEGQERAEARQLWTSVKDFSEASLNKTGSFPLFDEDWFESLLRTYLAEVKPALKAVTSNLAQPVSSVPPEAVRPKPPSNLPMPLNALLGRDQELADLTTLLQPASDVRLLTLTGPGGIGKTRLALQVAIHLAGVFEQGVFFVNLAPIREADLIIGAIAQTLELKEVAGQTITQRLKDYLRPRQLLLVLDNFEQVLTAGELIGELLLFAPGLKVVVTSRERLHLYREHEFEIQPLPLPGAEKLASLESLAGNPAIQLFIQQAQAVQPAFALTAENAAPLVALCGWLNGLPLAIELAAARSKRYDPAALLTLLGAGQNSRLEFLIGGPRNLPPRQQTLRNTLAWSYDLLTQAEQRLFERLAVFVGGFNVAAASAVWSVEEIKVVENEPPPLEALLDSLLDKNLLRQSDLNPSSPAEARFGMLEVIREYALERLALQPAEAVRALRTRYCQWALQTAQTLVARLKGPQEDLWLGRLELERANLRTALSYALESGPADPASVQTLIGLTSRLWRFWYGRGYFSEARGWLEAALDNSLGLPPTLENYRQRIDLILKLVSVSFFSDDPERNLTRLGEAEELARHSLAAQPAPPREDRLRLARVHYSKGLSFYLYNRIPEAVSYLEQVLATAQAVGEQNLLTNASAVYSRAFLNLGQFGKARPLLAQVLPLLEKGASWLEWSVTRAYLGMALAAQGQYAAGRAEVERALDFALQNDNLTGQAIGYANLAWVGLMTGDWPQMWEASCKAVEASEQSGDQFYLYCAYSFRGWAECHLGRPAAAFDSREQARQVAHNLGGRLLLHDWFMAADAEIAFEAGNYPLALTLAEQAVAEARQIGGLFSEGVAQRVWAKTLAAYPAAGQDREVAAHLAASLKAFEAGETVVQVARTHLVWRDLAREQGDLAAAQLHEKEATRLFEEIQADFNS